MKESKIITIVFSFILILSIPVLTYSYYYNEFIFNITISIVTGLVVSIVTSLCQYFVIKGKIKNNIFNCYFDLYKAIYVAERQKILFHYNVSNIYKKLIVFSDELSKNLAEYSGFISNKKNRLYKKLNPEFNLNYEKFNGKNILMLLLPFNYKKFNEMVIPLRDFLEKTLLKINKKKFKKEFEEYKRLQKLLWK